MNDQELDQSHTEVRENQPLTQTKSTDHKLLDNEFKRKRGKKDPVQVKA